MMRKKMSKVLAASLAVCALSVSVARAMPLALVNEYEVTSSAVNVGPATWQFTYEITNIDQGVPGYPYGLDGFAIQVPDSATLMGWTVPDPYVLGSIGYWTIAPGPAAYLLLPGGADPDYHWILWWGGVSLHRFTHRAVRQR